jgi:hypothetical protein
MNTKKLILCSTLLAAIGVAQAWNQEFVEYTWAENDDVQTVAGNYDVTAEQILVSNGLETEEITFHTEPISAGYMPRGRRFPFS